MLVLGEFPFHPFYLPLSWVPQQSSSSASSRLSSSHTRLKGVRRRYQLASRGTSWRSWQVQIVTLEKKRAGGKAGNSLDGIIRFAGFFVETYEDTCELVNDTCLLKVLSELLLLRISGLSQPAATATCQSVSQQTKVVGTHLETHRGNSCFSLFFRSFVYFNLSNRKPLYLPSSSTFQIRENDLPNHTHKQSNYQSFQKKDSRESLKR